MRTNDCVVGRRNRFKDSPGKSLKYFTIDTSLGTTSIFGYAHVKGGTDLNKLKWQKQRENREPLMLLHSYTFSICVVGSYKPRSV